MVIVYNHVQRQVPRKQKKTYKCGINANRGEQTEVCVTTLEVCVTESV